MPSAISHGIIGLAFSNPLAQKRGLSFTLLAIFCAVVPDLDAIGWMFHIDRASIWAHRGLTHSLLFAFVLSIVVVSLAFTNVPRLSKQWLSLVRYFFLVTTSHGLLDGLTNGGGVAFFTPFTSTRYLLPFRPLPPINISRFFSSSGEAVLLAEILWLWLPAVLILLFLARFRRKPAVARPGAF